MITTNGDNCVSLMQGTLVRPSARYPGSVATDESLKIAANRVQTTLRGSISSGDTIITVGDASRLVPDMLMSIDSEIISITSISGNNLTVVRGFDGTFTSSHASGSTLSSNIDAWHHNALAEEVKAIETALGPGLSNVSGSGTAGIINTRFDFSAQTPNVSLAPGNNSITLTPVPLGVNGSNLDHYLYVSGGTGAAEAVLITGGSAVSGAPSGTLIIQCANAHSGAWTIRTATSGIQEAVYSGGGSRISVQLAPSNLLTYAPVTIHGEEVCLYGYGQATKVMPQFSSGQVFYLTAIGNKGPGAAVGFRNTLQNFQIVGPGTGTLAGIELRGQLMCRITDVAVASTQKGIWLNDHDGADAVSSAVYIYRCMLEKFTPGTGVAFQQNGGADVFLVNNLISSDPANAALAGLLLVQSLGTKSMYNEVYGFQYALLFRPTTNNYVHAVESNTNWYDSSAGDAWRLEPQSTGHITEIHSTNDRCAGSAGNGIAFVNTTDVNTQAVIVSNALVVHNGTNGIYYSGGVDCEFNNCHVFANSRASSGTSHGFTAASGAGNFRIHGGTYGAVTGLPGEGAVNTQGWGIIVLAGASDNYIIEGVVASPNVAGSINDGGTGQNKIIRSNLNLQAGNPATAVITAGVVQLGNTPYEAVLLTGSATVTDLQPRYPGSRVLLLKTDAGTITFSATATIHNAATLGQNQAVAAQFVGSKWVLLS